jgi:hypothetical protein
MGLEASAKAIAVIENKEALTEGTSSLLRKRIGSKKYFVHRREILRIPTE